MLKMITALFLTTAVTGCSTMVSHKAATSSLANAKTCCDSIAQLPYKDIGFGASDSIKLDSSSPAFQFPTGKSYFAAFRLPAFTATYKITLQSYALGETIDKAHIFYPQIDFLDERYNVVTRSTPDEFVLNKSPLPAEERKTWGLPVRLEGSINVDNPGIRYMVVYTTTELLSSGNPYVTRRYTPIILPGIVGAIPTGREQISIPHSPFGILYIVLDNAPE